MFQRTSARSSDGSGETSHGRRTSPGAEQLGGDDVGGEDLAGDHAVEDQQADVPGIGHGQRDGVPRARREAPHGDVQLAARRLARLAGQELPEIGIEVEQRGDAMRRA